MEDEAAYDVDLTITCSREYFSSRRGIRLYRYPRTTKYKGHPDRTSSLFPSRKLASILGSVSSSCSILSIWSHGNCFPLKVKTSGMRMPESSTERGCPDFTKQKSHQKAFAYGNIRFIFAAETDLLKKSSGLVFRVRRCNKSSDPPLLLGNVAPY